MEYYLSLFLLTAQSRIPVQLHLRILQHFINVNTVCTPIFLQLLTAYEQSHEPPEESPEESSIYFRGDVPESPPAVESARTANKTTQKSLHRPLFRSKGE